MDAGFGQTDGYKVNKGYLPIDQSTKAQKDEPVQSPTNTPKSKSVVMQIMFASCKSSIS